MAEPANGQVTAGPAGPRVLVVDDTDEVRVLIRRALAGHGYRVDDAASLAQATALDPAGYDVVLVDAHLGADMGTDLIDTLVAQDPAAAGRCLVITGGSSGVVPHGVAILAKPFRPSDLLDAVRALHQPDSAAARPPAAAAGNGSAPARPPAAQPPAAQPPAAQPPAAQPTAAQPTATQPTTTQPTTTQPTATQPTAAQPIVPQPAAPQPAAARPGGQASRMPPAWRLLGMIRGLRSSERATVADFVHDGPIQELAAAALAIALSGRAEQAGVTRIQDELQQQIDAAGRSLRYLTDGDWPFLPPGASLPETIRQRTSWLPLSSVTVDIRQTCAALRAEAPLIADVVELALFLMTSDGPLSQADICVQAGENEAEIVLTLTQPGDVRDWAADTGELAELASILGGTAYTERGPARWQVRIAVPRQCSVADRRR
jgi:CheY-like chemotaxis protein